VGPTSVHSGNGRPLIAPRHLLVVLVSTPLQIVHRCCSYFPVSGNVGPLTFNLSVCVRNNQISSVVKQI